MHSLRLLIEYNGITECSTYVHIIKNILLLRYKAYISLGKDLVYVRKCPKVFDTEIICLVNEYKLSVERSDGFSSVRFDIILFLKKTYTLISFTVLFMQYLINVYVSYLRI